MDSKTHKGKEINNEDIVVYSHLSDIFGNNNEIKNLEPIKKNDDFIFANNSIIEGNGNSIYGHVNKVTGDNNKIYGCNNSIDGNKNNIIGNNNLTTGFYNVHEGEFNKFAVYNQKNIVQYEVSSTYARNGGYTYDIDKAFSSLIAHMKKNSILHKRKYDCGHFKEETDSQHICSACFKKLLVK